MSAKMQTKVLAGSLQLSERSLEDYAQKSMEELLGRVFFKKNFKYNFSKGSYISKGYYILTKEKFLEAISTETGKSPGEILKRTNEEISKKNFEKKSGRSGESCEGIHRSFSLKIQEQILKYFLAKFLEKPLEELSEESLNNILE